MAVSTNKRKIDRQTDEVRRILGHRLRLNGTKPLEEKERVRSEDAKDDRYVGGRKGVCTVGLATSERPWVERQGTPI